MGGVMPGRIASFFRNLLRKRAIEQALDDELKSAVELLAQEKMKQGLSHPEARRQALIELGGVEQVKEEVRAIRPRPTLHPPPFAQISRVHDRSCPHSRARDWRKCRNIQLHRRLVYQTAALPTTRPAGDLRDPGQETRMDKRGSYFRGGLFRFSKAKHFV